MSAQLETNTQPRFASRGTLRRAARWLGLACAELLLLGAGPCLLLLADYFTYGAGVPRFATLVALFALVAVASSGRIRLRSVLASGPGRLLLIAGALYAFGLAGTQFLHDVQHPEPCWTDMGRPSVCAGEMLLAGTNPWATCARKPPAHAPEPSESMRWCLTLGGCPDYKGGGEYSAKRWKHHGPGFEFMDGYKYGPLMALLYLPATHLRQEGGIAVVNFAFWLGLSALAMLLARAVYPRIAGSATRALLVLMLPAVLPAYRVLPTIKFDALDRHYVLAPPMRAAFVRALTLMCSNDFIPVFFLLVACWFALHRRSWLAGIQLGLSLATKQLPGLLLLLPLVRVRGIDGKRLAFAALLTAGVFYYPWFAGAPREMIANLILFGFVRPTNSSSIRRFLPHDLEALVSLAQLGLSALLITRFMRGEQRDVRALLRSAALLAIGFVALNKVVHGNYFLWIQPLLALVMAGAPFAERGEPSAELKGENLNRQGAEDATLREKRI